MNEILASFLGYRVDIIIYIISFCVIGFMCLIIGMVCLEDVLLRITYSDLSNKRRNIYTKLANLGIILLIAVIAFLITELISVKKTYDRKTAKVVSSMEQQVVQVSNSKIGKCLTTKSYEKKSKKFNYLKPDEWEYIEILADLGDGQQKKVPLVYPKEAEEFVEYGMFYGQTIEYFNFEVDEKILAEHTEYDKNSIKKFEDFKFLLQLGDYKVTSNNITDNTLKSIYSYWLEQSTDVDANSISSLLTNKEVQTYNLDNPIQE